MATFCLHGDHIGTTLMILLKPLPRSSAIYVIVGGTGNYTGLFMPTNPQNNKCIMIEGGRVNLYFEENTVNITGTTDALPVRTVALL